MQPLVLRPCYHQPGRKAMLGLGNDRGQLRGTGRPADVRKGHLHCPHESTVLTPPSLRGCTASPKQQMAARVLWRQMDLVPDLPIPLRVSVLSKPLSGAPLSRPLLYASISHCSFLTCLDFIPSFQPGCHWSPCLPNHKTNGPHN